MSKLQFKNRQAWRSWLNKNHRQDLGVRLVIYKKAHSKKGLAYEEAVEEALCFGWIDGQLKRLDDEKHLIHFSPRRKNSIWAPSNVTRFRKMKKQGKMTKAGLAVFPKILPKQKSNKPVNVPKKLRMPIDLNKALKTNKKATEHFKNYPPSFRKTIIWWVLGAKQKETRQRRIRDIVQNAAKHERPTY